MVSIKERLDWCRKRWTEDPQISVNGKHGMVAQMMEVFGVAAHVNQLLEVHAEVAREQREEVKATDERERNFNPAIKVPLKLADLGRSDKRAADVPPPPRPPEAIKPPAPPPSPAPVQTIVPPDSPLGRLEIMQAGSYPLPRPRVAAEGTHHGETPLATKIRRTPDGTSPRRPEDAKIREDYARAVAQPGMRIVDLQAAVRERFGWGIDSAKAVGLLHEIRQDAPSTGPGAPDGTSKTIAVHVAVREAYARQIAYPGMTVQALLRALRDRFGWGLSREIMARIVEEATGSPPPPSARDMYPSAPMAAPVVQPRPTPPAPGGGDPGAQIKAAIELLLEEVPGLVALHVTREPGQRPEIEFDIKVVQSGRFKL